MRPALTRVAVPALLAAGALTGCSSATATPVSPVRAQVPVAPAPHVSASAATAAARPAPAVVTIAPPATTTPAALPTCRGEQLAVSVAGTDGAAGHMHAVVALANHGAPCALTGYPALRLLDARGAALPLTVTRAGDMAFPAVGAREVRLAAGASASFDLGYSQVPTGAPTACATGTALVVTAPQTSTGLRLALTMDPCDHGHVAISPLVPGTAGVA